MTETKTKEGSQAPFCLMPWIHFHAGNKGVVKACCVANIAYGNINEQSLEEIWQGDAIKQLRAKFEKNISDKRCFGCLNREKAGNKSIRQETFEKFPDVNIEAMESPIYFDIRFSNVCNFKCKTCWHGASSKWFEDAKKLGRTASNKAIIQNISDFNQFISKTGAALLNAKEIYFAGGEPLVTEEHYRLLEYLIENESKGIHLRYNTNFSKLKFKHWDVLELWRQFESLEIMASVDDYGAKGESLRNGFRWDIFESNHNALKSLTHIKFKISPTISVYNVKSLPDFYLRLVRERFIEPDDFYINILERPYYFNVKIFSEIEKVEITEIYEIFLANNEMPSRIREGFQSIIAFMNQQNLHEKYWDKFLKEEELLSQM